MRAFPPLMDLCVSWCQHFSINPKPLSSPLTQCVYMCIDDNLLYSQHISQHLPTRSVHSLLVTGLRLGKEAHCRRVNGRADNVLFLKYWGPLIFLLPLMSNFLLFAVSLGLNETPGNHLPVKGVLLQTPVEPRVPGDLNYSNISRSLLCVGGYIDSFLLWVKRWWLWSHCYDFYLLYAQTSNKGTNNWCVWRRMLIALMNTKAVAWKHIESLYKGFLDSNKRDNLLWSKQLKSGRLNSGFKSQVCIN